METVGNTTLLLHFCFFLLVFQELAVAPETGPVVPTAPASSPAPTKGRSNLAPFRPSIVVIIGVVTTIFSVTFLMLLYAKHCIRRSTGGPGIPVYGWGAPSSSFRRNSGVNRKVIELLPIFRFASLRGPNDGLECAVCLNPFEPAEILRLLPKCKHAFHVECVDTWLESHSTCPLCRFRVDPEDVFLVIEEFPEPVLHPSSPPPPSKQVEVHENPHASSLPALVSGRHSSAGEKSTRTPTFPTNILSSRVSADAAVCREWDGGAGRAVGCFYRARKERPILLPDGMISDRRSSERRLSHRIVVSDSPAVEQRLSDVNPSDILFLHSDMFVTDRRRYSTGTCDVIRHPGVSVPEGQSPPVVRLDVVATKSVPPLDRIDIKSVPTRNPDPRSVSEIVSLSRFCNRFPQVNKWQSRFSVS